MAEPSELSGGSARFFLVIVPLAQQRTTNRHGDEFYGSLPTINILPLRTTGTRDRSSPQIASTAKVGTDAQYARVGELSVTGALTKLEIVTAEAATMSSPVVVKDSGTIAADAVEDQAWLECTSEEIAHLGSVNDKALRYVAGRLTMSNAGGECVVFYELTGGRFAYNDLTPATTIA